jgi:hypothetical protein
MHASVLRAANRVDRVTKNSGSFLSRGAGAQDAVHEVHIRYSIDITARVERLCASEKQTRKTTIQSHESFQLAWWQQAQEDGRKRGDLGVGPSGEKWHAGSPCDRARGTGGGHVCSRYVTLSWTLSVRSAIFRPVFVCRGISHDCHTLCLVGCFWGPQLLFDRIEGTTWRPALWSERDLSFPASRLPLAYAHASTHARTHTLCPLWLQVSLRPM